VFAPQAQGLRTRIAAAIGIDPFVTNDDRLSRKVIPGISFLCALDRVPL